MRRSTERILVSHAGALPKPEDLQRLFDAYPGEQEAFTAALPGAVREVVGQQAAAGVDVVNDGEISKRGIFIGYLRDRMAGFEEVPVKPGQFRPENAGVTGRDRRDFPGFYAAGLYVNCQVVDAGLKATGGDASDDRRRRADGVRI